MITCVSIIVIVIVIITIIIITIIIIIIIIIIITNIPPRAAVGRASPGDRRGAKKSPASVWLSSELFVVNHTNAYDIYIYIYMIYTHI